jgi:hypothetical protein
MDLVRGFFAIAFLLLEQADETVFTLDVAEDFPAVG